MKKILVIEDDPYVRKFYERLFRNDEHDVIIAENGTDGIRQALNTKPNLILLDIVMPQMSGMEVLDVLKTNPETKDIPVVMLTNIDDTSVIQEARKKGVAGFLVKAYYEPEALRAHVESLIK